MTYLVQLTPRAEGDIERIFDWLSNRSHEGARRWYESFWESAERLRDFPRSFGLAPEDEDFADELRQMLFGTRHGRIYRALFVVRDDVVQILCVRGPGERRVGPGDLGA